MVARYDKYVPEVSGTRAALNATIAGAVGTIIGVGLNANGRIVKGAGNTGIIGVLVINSAADNVAGRILDVMSLGDIVDTAANLPAGTVFTVVDSTGVVSAAAGANPTIAVGSSYVGHTIEAGRLAVRFDRRI